MESPKQVLQMLESQLRQKREYLIRLETEHNLLLQSLADYESSLNEARNLEQSLDHLQVFFHALSTQEQVKLQRWMETTISYGLATVFGPEFKFVIVGPDIRANDVVIGFRIVDSSSNQRDPYRELGGGLADVLSFLLQFVLVHLLSKRITPILFLDEPFKHLSPQYRDPMAMLLRQLVEKTSVRIVMVTHEPIYQKAADSAYHFVKEGKVTSVQRE